MVDDTPKADRNRKPSEPPAEVTDEELEEYSEKVRNRIKHFSKGYMMNVALKKRLSESVKSLKGWLNSLWKKIKTLKERLVKTKKPS